MPAINSELKIIVLPAIKNCQWCIEISHLFHEPKTIMQVSPLNQPWVLSPKKIFLETIMLRKLKTLQGTKAKPKVKANFLA